MKGTFAYSLDRETFTGVFNTREEAFHAGCYAAERLHANITEVYVGQRVAGDPQADLHAWELIKSMRDRARAAATDGEANDYLAHVTEAQANDFRQRVVWSGEGVDLVRDIPGAREVIERIVDEAAAVLRGGAALVKG